MEKKHFFVVMFALLLVMLTACSGNNDRGKSSQGSDSQVQEADKSTSSKMETDKSNKLADKEHTQGKNENADDAESQKNTKQETPDPKTDRMVIYNADMKIGVKAFQPAQEKLQSLVDQADGYIVNSSVSNHDNDKQQSKITVRIPQPQFDPFLNQIEDIAEDVKERSVNGEDVTKQYVDLKSRLKAKKEVKKRLDSFLKEAKNSEDLLDISKNLANVQEEIEQIKGQMKYLENHSALATVTITMIEENVEVGGVKQKKDLNTWAKTKKAFVQSTNAIITFFSGVVIFLIGYSPILIPVLIIAAVIFLIYRRRKRKEH